MKTKVTTSIIFLVSTNVQSDNAATNSSQSYLIGGIIALLIMGYLIYTLMRPDKF